MKDGQGGLGMRYPRGSHEKPWMIYVAFEEQEYMVMKTVSTESRRRWQIQVDGLCVGVQTT